MILLYAACSPIARIVAILTFSLAKTVSHVKLYVVLQHNGNAYLMQIPSADKCGRGVDQVLKVCIDRCVLQKLCIVLYVDRGAGEELKSLHPRPFACFNSFQIKPHVPSPLLLLLQLLVCSASASLTAEA